MSMAEPQRRPSGDSNAAPIEAELSEVERRAVAVLPLLARPSSEKLLHVLRLWGIVLATNIAGSLTFAWVVSHTQAFSADARAAFAVLGTQVLEKGLCREAHQRRLCRLAHRPDDLAAAAG